jgi:hypothetical protein
MTRIDAVLYSYKNKNLKLVVESLLNNTKNDIHVKVFDQNTIDRTSMFQDPRLDYTHIMWDKIYSPSERKGDAIDKSDADYILELSDDCLLSDGWDTVVIDIVQSRGCVVSGNSFKKLFRDGPFFFSTTESESKTSKLVNYIDKDFIFTKNKIWKSIQYPYFLKYHGEAEMLSLNFFKAGYDIYSAPERIYTNLGLKTLDRLYVPYSKDHNYNIFVDRISGPSSEQESHTKRTSEDFFSFHGIEDFRIKKLPYPTNDVLYDQYGLNFQDMDARKFISRTKSIY